MSRDAREPDGRFAATAAPLIAADVGGTYARIALVHVEGEGAPELRHYRRYACADHPDLGAILRGYVEDAGIVRAPRAAVAIAGVAAGDALLNANLPWPVSFARVRKAAGLQELAVINDFEALAWAAPGIDPDTGVLLGGPAGAPAPGPVLLIGPGSGLGAAVHFPGPPSLAVATEAGHATLAVGNERELRLLRALQQQWPHVNNERVLSGPGLVNAYRALCDIESVEPRLRMPAEVAAAAQDGGDPIAVETLRIFCALLGSLAGDLALVFGARAVYLAGGIPTQIAPFLCASDFSARFLGKGVMGEALARVPVRLIEHGRLGLLGAALWYLRRGATDATTVALPWVRTGAP